MVEQHRRRRRRSDNVENRIGENNNNRHRNVRKRRDLECTIAHAKTFSQVLSGIQLNPTKRGGQKVKAWISNRGIGFISLDQSKSLKATAIFRRGTFERFRVGFGRNNQEEEEDEEDEEAEEEENEENETTRREERRGGGGGGGEATGGGGDCRPRARNNNANNGNEPPEEEEIKKYIGMSLDAFVDVLEMFANRSNGNALLGEDCAGGQTVSLSYPDRHGRVALESNSVRETTVIGGGGGGSENQRGLRPLRQTTYADVATEANVFGEDEDEMNNEDDEDRDEFLRIGRALVTFVLPTTRWKEIIEDLEWANANVSLIATRDSLAFVSESSDIGSVKVDVDLSSLVEYSFREASPRGGEGGGGGRGGGDGGGEGQTSNKRKQKWTYKQEFLKRSTMVPTHSGAVIATAGGTNNTFGQYRQTQTQTQTQGGGGGAGGFHLPHHRHHHVETDEAYKATTKISVGETGVLKVAHMLRLRALLGHHQSNAFGDTNATTADQNDGVGNSLRGGGGASTCNVPVTFVMASVIGDDHDDDGMGSGEEHEEYDAE
ncbi:unnamed protein product [Bathycoccus prasinos]